MAAKKRSGTGAARASAFDIEGVEAVLERHADALLAYPNVNGVGIREERLPNGNTAAVVQVTVSQKIPDDNLDPSERIPREIEGVNVRVREVGTLKFS